MAGPKLTLYVDTVSPFGYFAFHILRTSPAFAACEITYTPVFLGGIMKETGNRPPLVIKNKDKWIERERKRWAQMFGIPVAERAPDGFPVNTISVQRALAAVARDHPARLAAAVGACYEAFWVQRNAGDVTGAGLGRMLAGVLGERDAQGVLAAAKTDEVKALLNTTTREAIDAGAFGLPYFVATNAKGETDVFWGVDHIGLVVDHLGLDRSLLGGKSRALL